MKAVFTFRRKNARLGSRKEKPGLRFWQVWPLWLIMGLFVAGGIAALVTVIRQQRPHKDDVAEIQLLAGQDLRVAIDKLEAGRVYLFSQEVEQGRRLRYVVQRTPDGAVHSNLASCQACYRSERPHYISKGQVMCRMCNHPMHRPDEKGLTKVQKRCALIPLAHSTQDGKVVVDANEVLGQAQTMETK